MTKATLSSRNFHNLMKTLLVILALLATRLHAQSLLPVLTPYNKLYWGDTNAEGIVSGYNIYVGASNVFVPRLIPGTTQFILGTNLIKAFNLTGTNIVTLTAVAITGEESASSVPFTFTVGTNRVAAPLNIRITP